MGAYLDGLLIRRAGEEGDESRVRELGDPRMSEDFPMTGKANQKPLEEKLALIRTDIRRVVHEFLGAPTVAHRITGAIAWQRILDKAPGRAPTFRVQGVAADVREGVTYRLLEDLAQAGTLVRQCPATGCGRVFVRRHRQEFCSTACRHRTNFRIWYERTRKARKGTIIAPRASKRKQPTHWRRARIMGKSIRRAKSA